MLCGEPAKDMLRLKRVIHQIYTCQKKVQKKIAPSMQRSESRQVCAIFVKGMRGLDANFRSSSCEKINQIPFSF